MLRAVLGRWGWGWVELMGIKLVSSRVVSLRRVPHHLLFYLLCKGGQDDRTCTTYLMRQQGAWRARCTAGNGVGTRA